LFVFVGGLLLAVAWDADGNPNTDNLPQACLTTVATDTVKADVDPQMNQSSTPHVHRACLHPASTRTRAIRELLWGKVAAPARGP